MIKNYFEHVNIEPIKRDFPGITVEEYHSDTSRIRFNKEFQDALIKALPIDEEKMKKELLNSRNGDNNGNS